MRPQHAHHCTLARLLPRQCSGIKGKDTGPAQCRLQRLVREENSYYLAMGRLGASWLGIKGRSHFTIGIQVVYIVCTHSFHMAMQITGFS